VELRRVIGAGLAVAAGEGICRSVEALRAILHGEVEPEQLADHWCCGIVDSRWSRRYFRL